MKARLINLASGLACLAIMGGLIWQVLAALAEGAR